MAATQETLSTTTVEASTATTAILIPTAPILTLTKTLIRPYHESDAPLLAEAASNPLIAKYMRNAFPNPYTLADAQSWITIATVRQPLRNFAVCHADGTYAGGIGLKPIGDVEYRTMEIGYWFGQAHWGAGLATDAVVGFSRWCFENIPELLRLEAGVFGPNVASARVLEKAGYTLEGVRRKAACKNGEVIDIKMYALLKEECLGVAATE